MECVPRMFVQGHKCKNEAESCLVLQIMYVTGETEELDLLEIVREGHMSLISDNTRAYL